MTQFLTRKLFAPMFLCALVTACALTELVSMPSEPTATRAPVVNATPPRITVDVLATTAAATAAPTATRGSNPTPATPAAATPTRAPQVAATATPTGDPLVGFAQQFDGQAAYEHTRALTTPAMAGRKYGTTGGDKAAQYIADKFKAAGLKPIGDNNTYFQNFTMPFIDLAEVSLKLLNGDGSVNKAFKHHTDFRESGTWLTENANANGAVVFLGRGTDKDLAAGGDLTGKIVLVFQPQNTQVLQWVKGLWDKGVAGVLVINNNPAAVTFKSSFVVDSPRKGETRPLLVVTRAVALALLQLSDAKLQELEDKMNRDEGVFAPTANRVSMTLKLAPIRDVRVMNVLGAIQGSDPQLAHEVVIVGGHYDHVGYDPDGGAAFDGANDNASGTAVVIALAEHFAKNKIHLKRTLVFAAWTAEESGLVGSTYYTRHPLYPLNQTIAYINLDVVGAGGGAGLTITNDSPQVASTARESANDLNIRTGGTSIGGGSDHEAFLKVGVRATFFIWQQYGDIHVPTDTFDKIDVNKLKATGQVAALTLLRLANQ
jgi:hypothetical protein